MKRSLLALALLLAATPACLAHGPKIGEHGGPQTDAGSFHVEAVVKDLTLDVYLNDHAAKPVAVAGFKGVAILKAADGKPVRIPLSPASDNKLTGVAPSPLPPEFEGAVQITTQTGSMVVGKFGGEHEH